ncbi:MAG: hypothetical protein WBQ44_06170 [Rhodococcus sp. (in: high G+C Gram-positive bacteria)]
MKYLGLLSTYLVLLLMLATLPDSAVAAVAFGIVLSAVAVTVVAVTGRKALLRRVFGVADVRDRQQRRRGSYRRQERPDEAGRPLARAPGLTAGAI